MIFEELSLPGAYLIRLEPVEDDRGANIRSWCAREFEDAGLTTRVSQVNIIRNAVRGTLRGMHYQTPPLGEAKLFRVTSGRIHDVIVDLRPDSATYLGWTSVELSADALELLFVPKGFAQGFQTLEDDTELTYQVSEFYSPEHGAGFRYDDPTFGIDWPLDVTAISAKDGSWPRFEVPS